MDDSFETTIPQGALGPLLQIGTELGFDPTGSEEAEAFFTALVATYSGSSEGLETWLREQLVGRFQCLNEMPRWIQNPTWQFTTLGPMLFVGQLDTRPGLFHDDASFYTFFEVRTGVVRAIVQVA